MALGAPCGSQDFFERLDPTLWTPWALFVPSFVLGPSSLGSWRFLGSQLLAPPSRFLADLDSWGRSRFLVPSLSTAGQLVLRKCGTPFGPKGRHLGGCLGGYAAARQAKQDSPNPLPRWRLGVPEENQAWDSAHFGKAGSVEAAESVGGPPTAWVKPSSAFSPKLLLSGLTMPRAGLCRASSSSLPQSACFSVRVSGCPSLMVRVCRVSLTESRLGLRLSSLT